MANGAGFDNTEFEFTLESILAEYKGSAYIDGDKKTPSDILEEKAQKIIMEVTGIMAETSLSSEDSLPDFWDEADEGHASGKAAHRLRNVAPIEQPPLRKRAEPELQAERTPEEQDVKMPEVIEPPTQKPVQTEDRDILFFDNYRYSSPDVSPDIEHEVQKAIEREMKIEEGTRETARRAFGIFRRGRRGEEYVDEQPAYCDPDNEPYVEPVYEEPDLMDALSSFSDTYGGITLRQIASMLVSLIMVVFTVAFETGRLLPFGIGSNQILITGILLILQLVVMMLGIDILSRGMTDLLRGSPNAETLILFSCVFSLVSGAFSMLREAGPPSLPYSVVSAMSVAFALWGEKLYTRAIAGTLKTAVSSAEPYGVIAEYRHDIEKSVLRKVPKRIEGFYNNLMHPDISETAYRFAAPLLLAASLILAGFTVIIKSSGPYFLHILSALLAASASFSALIAFAAPFVFVMNAVKKSGAAIAGWGGADDIWHTDGSCVTDDDLFPPGTLSINGVKIFEDVSPEKAIRYTASLIMASGSGLSRVFSEMLTKQGMSMIKVEDFACYEGGIGGLIRGERVMTGSAAFMNLLGIRIPDDMNLKNAVFTAVNDKLIAMFAVGYVPVNSVQSALIAILKWKVKLFFAVRDFNITPLMLGQKFKVPVDDVEYVAIQNSYDISDETSESNGRTASILTREGLGPFGEAVTGGRLLRNTALASTAASIVSAALGVLIMFYTCWAGAFESARPGNLLLFMLSMLAVVLIICGYVKAKK